MGGRIATAAEIHYRRAMLARPVRAGSLLPIVLCFTAATVTGEEIEIAPRLRAGDEFRLEFIHTRENSSRPAHNAKITSAIIVRVLTATPEGWTLEWIADDASIDNAQLAREPAVTAAMAAMRGVSLNLKLGPDGEFTGLANEQEVVSRLQAAVDAMMRELKSTIPEEQRPTFQSMMSSVLSPAMLLASATRDVQMYFGLNGATLEVGEPLEVEMQQPTPLGGEPLPCRLRVTAASATETEAVIVTTTTFDGAVFTKMTEAMLAKAGQSPRPEDPASLPPMKMTDEATYTFDRKLGLTREARIERRIDAGPARRVDKWNIHLRKAPKR
jgi:hypothetical protein